MLAPQTNGQQPAPAMPSFQPGGQAQAAPAKAEKPVIHGLLSGQELDDRVSQMPREAQMQFLKMCSEDKNLANFAGILIGPEAHDYIEMIQKAIAQQQGQSNSPQAPADAGGLVPEDSAPQGAPSTTSATPPAPAGLAPAGV